MQVVGLVGDSHEQRSKAKGERARHTVGGSQDPQRDADTHGDPQQHEALAPHPLDEEVDRAKEKGQEITGQADTCPERPGPEDGIGLFLRRCRSVLVVEREPALPNLGQGAAVLWCRHRSNLAGHTAPANVSGHHYPGPNDRWTADRPIR